MDSEIQKLIDQTWCDGCSDGGRCRGCIEKIVKEWRKMQTGRKRLPTIQPPKLLTRIVVLDPDGDVVWNDNTQKGLFHSIGAAKKVIKEYMKEPCALDLDTGREVTVAEEYGWKEGDFKIFQEIEYA